MVADLNNPVRLKESQIKPAAEMMARAFQDDPFCAYFIPDVSGRKDKLPYLFEFLIRYGVVYGEVYAISPNLEGVAVWLPPEKVHMTQWRGIRSGGLPLLFKVGIKSVLRQMSAADYILSVHKRHTPFRHWFLQAIGVDPMFHGKGYAGTLLKAILARMDQEHLPCYLDTQNEKNVPIYRHYGFKVVEKVVIPGTEVRHWAMLREKSG